MRLPSRSSTPCRGQAISRRPQEVMHRRDRCAPRQDDSRGDPYDITPPVNRRASGTGVPSLKVPGARRMHGRQAPAVRAGARGWQLGSPSALAAGRSGARTICRAAGPEQQHSTPSRAGTPVPTAAIGSLGMRPQWPRHSQMTAPGRPEHPQSKSPTGARRRHAHISFCKSLRKRVRLATDPHL